MNRSRIVIVVVAIALAVGLAWYHTGSQYPEVEVADVPAEDAGAATRSLDVKQPPVGQATPQYKPAEDFSKVAFTNSDRQLIAELDVPEAAVRKLFKVIDSITAPIEFYGRVVDQHGASVEGAKVAYSVDSAPGFGPPSQYTATTDKDGRFSVTSVRGLHLNIPKVSKEGYAFNLLGGYFRIRSKDPAHLVSTYTADNPYVIHAWKLPEPAVMWSVQDSKIKLIPDGRPYSVTFTKHRARIVEGRSDKAHLRISMTAVPDEKLYRQGNWSIVLEAVNGGVQPTEDVLMYEAPETGYVQRWEKVYALGEKNYTYMIGHQKFYYAGHNRGVYGWLILDIYPFTYISKAQLDKGITNDSSIYLNYTVNPHGSRNLYGGKLNEQY